MISKIYGSNQILFAAGSRKGKTKKQIANMVRNKQYKKRTYTKTVKHKESYKMAFIKLGKVTMYVNKDATEQNKQPHFRGNLTIDENIPKGSTIGVAGWLNEKGSDKSLFFAVSAKEDDLKGDIDTTDKEGDLPF